MKTVIKKELEIDSVVRIVEAARGDLAVYAGRHFAGRLDLLLDLHEGEYKILYYENKSYSIHPYKEEELIVGEQKISPIKIQVRIDILKDKINEAWNARSPENIGIIYELSIRRQELEQLMEGGLPEPIVTQSEFQEAIEAAKIEAMTVMQDMITERGMQIDRLNDTLAQYQSIRSENEAYKWQLEEMRKNESKLQVALSGMYNYYKEHRVESAKQNNLIERAEAALLGVSMPTEIVSNEVIEANKKFQRRAIEDHNEIARLKDRIMQLAHENETYNKEIAKLLAANEKVHQQLADLQKEYAIAHDTLWNAYIFFSRMGFNWEGRDSVMGQNILAMMRDATNSNNENQTRG